MFITVYTVHITLNLGLYGVLCVCHCVQCTHNSKSGFIQGVEGFATVYSVHITLNLGLYRVSRVLQLCTVYSVHITLNLGLCRVLCGYKCVQCTHNSKSRFIQGVVCLSLCMLIYMVYGIHNDLYSGTLI